MKLNYLRFGTTALVWLLGTSLVAGQQLTDQSEISLNDLSAFKDPGPTWSIAGGVTANLDQQDVLKVAKGSGVLVSIPKKNAGRDLYTVAEHGDMILELEYLLAKGGNSGIYLQGVYEIQLEDAWGLKNPKASNNGGIYQRWDDSRPEGQKGYDGYAPRQNASKAPGLWQKMRIAFRAPRFDGSGKKVQNARMVAVELNGVLIHDNVELFGVTRGANGGERAVGPLRLQGDHGAVAFRNIKISKLPADAQSAIRQRENSADPIYVDPANNPLIRSFVDIAGGTKVVHAISVSSPEEVHYGYDLDNGVLFHAWHGEFVDATPMWHERGNGTSRPRGTVTTFTKKPVPALAKLLSAQDSWLNDTTGTGFQTKGYELDGNDRPTFVYKMYGTRVKDAIRANENGQGLTREITLEQPVSNIYHMIASGSAIEDLGKGLYLIDGQSYYIKFSDSKMKPMVKDANGTKQLIAPVNGKLSYSILF
ncbi:3-keto-disaccharide hydrolase [Pedobacter deserti]|uniref:3-keto-disaccharide hydrolase n=1 Tax=Pedobacter deserti TaxID=2817382 RepID=UPI00210F0B14|nr:DUF1080 domain-containing protein [Pedobacter sp. SYSU D00382]